MGWIGSAVWAGSSKTAPRIFIFSIVLGAEYLSYVKSIATFSLTFFGYIISVLASDLRYFVADFTNLVPLCDTGTGLDPMCDDDLVSVSHG